MLTDKDLLAKGKFQALEKCLYLRIKSQWPSKRKEDFKSCFSSRQEGVKNNIIEIVGK